MRVAVISFMLFVSIVPQLRAQTNGVLTIEEFLTIVREHHPVAKQASLMIERSEFEVMQAKGAFDPKLMAEYNAKFFSNKAYYEIWDSYLKVPTILNIDFKAGYEQAAGQYLNPENTVPNSGLYYAGVSIPLGQGLITSARNIGLKQSRIEQSNLQNEAKIVLNNLMLDASLMYYEWYAAFSTQQIIQNNLNVVKQQYEGVRDMSRIGERAAIDSTEMLIQFQKWKNEAQKAELDYGNSQLLLNNFLWNDGFDITHFKPQLSNTGNVNTDSYYLEWINQHPELQVLRNTTQYYELERKLSMEMIKPKLNVNYNFLLAEQYDLEQHQFLGNNYKAGLDFEFPLLVRKERAKLQQNSLKQQEYELKTLSKTRQITNKVTTYFNKATTLNQLIEQQREIVRNYEILVEAERTKFDNGESSVFLVNSRLNKKLESELKLIDLETEFRNTIALLNWSSAVYVAE